MKRIDTRAKVFFVSHDYGRVEVTPDVTSVTTTKGMTGPGSWSVQLIPTRRSYLASDYLRDFRPDDWAEIYLTTDDSDGDQLVMWGPLSQITRSRRAGGSGSALPRITVNGTDWFKTLANFEASFDPILADIFEYPVMMQQLASSNALGCFTAGQIVQLLFKGLTNFRPTSDQYSLPKAYGKRLFDLVQTANVNPLVGGGLVLADVPTIMSGSLMNVLQYFSDTTNNFFYGDIFKTIGPGIGLLPGWTPHLVMDRHPYSDAAFSALPPTVFPYLSAKEDVSGDNLGYHDHDIANWFRVRPQVLGDVHDDLALPAGPIINKESIRRHGIRRMNGDMPYSFPPASTGITENTQTATIPTLVMQSVWRIAQWYTFNENLLNGSLDCRLLPKARVNTRLTYMDEYTKETYQFYVEQVSHHWSYSPVQSNTTLAVTRGYPDTPATAEARQIALARLTNASITGQVPPGTLDVPLTPGNMA